MLVKHVIIISCSFVFLTACSSSTSYRKGSLSYNIDLPDNWDIVESSDPNELIISAPSENGYKSQLKINALQPYPIGKTATAHMLKDSFEKWPEFRTRTSLTTINGEPTVALVCREEESSKENPIQKMDVTHYGYFVCADDYTYSLDFSFLTSDPEEKRRKIVSDAINSFQPSNRGKSSLDEAVKTNPLAQKLIGVRSYNAETNRVEYRRAKDWKEAFWGGLSNGLQLGAEACNGGN
jgi:hypothetical protein